MFRLRILLYDKAGYVRYFEFLYFEYPEPEQIVDARMWVMALYLTPGGSLKPERITQFID